MTGARLKIAQHVVGDAPDEVRNPGQLAVLYVRLPPQKSHIFS
ncbi:MAG: hypothetical protein BSOLF_2522 [Candidatus Carbobacillus altaicus]|uniref:Uncharacterized protein n=1 Tax=Candidatus Carbonibacillus altaicus TaxID=2163959 RepID=A0A2R6XXY7_9BACL|nr:MAG: hypothetical protein BSOLF_2522 [Candidatus Carbobacillus altaicus]